MREEEKGLPIAKLKKTNLQRVAYLRQFAEIGWLQEEMIRKNASGQQVVARGISIISPQALVSIVPELHKEWEGARLVKVQDDDTPHFQSTSPEDTYAHEPLQDQQAQESHHTTFPIPTMASLARVVGSLRQRMALHKRQKRVPVMQQMGITECGAACLAMILNYYGHQISIAEVSTECGVGRDGLSASALAKAGRRYGLSVQAIAFENLANFERLALPAIVYWQFKHFVIVERWSPDRVSVVDPAAGRKTMTRDEFSMGFTGVALVLEPGPAFVQRRGEAKSLFLRTYTQSILKLAPWSLFQIFLTSLILLMFGLAMPLTTAIVVNKIVPHALSNLLLVFGLGMVSFLIVQALIGYVRSLLLIKLEAIVDKRLMIGFFDHLLSLPLQYFQLRSRGDLLSRLASNTVIRDIVNTQFISSLLNILSVFVYFFILLNYSFLFLLLTLAFGLAQMVLIVSTNKVILDSYKRNLAAQAKSEGYLTEVLVEITTLKAAGAENYARDRWQGFFSTELSTKVKINSLQAFFTALQSILQSLAPVILLLVGTQQVIAGSLQLGTMLAMLSLSASFLTPLTSLVSTFQQLQQVYAHLERIADVMKAKPEQHDEQPMHPPRLTGHIQLTNVTFQYDMNTKPVLHDINVTIHPGQKIAIVGRSGAGKSTLGKLLLGLYLPTQGEILYDHIPLSLMDYREVRAQFGVVMQTIGLFNGSIRENITFNQPDIDFKAIVQAAQSAALHDDIEAMPMTYETVVSEGGNALSGGQRQRLALARALVRKPAVLLLDEATSSLDVTTERVIEQNMQRLACTQIIIAHRLSTIRNADLILVIDQGTIIEQGTHTALLQHRGFYANLIESQLVNGEIQHDIRLVQ